MTRTLRTGLTALLVAAAVVQAWGHCQVPCGIYGDEARFAMLEENMQTIEKAMGKIRQLAPDPAQANQVVRWTLTKEEHANDTMDIIANYFLAQRIKQPAADDAVAGADYAARLVSLHGMLVEAMKCKQTTDTAHVGRFRELLQTFHGQYFGETHQHGGAETR